MSFTNYHQIMLEAEQAGPAPSTFPPIFISSRGSSPDSTSQETPCCRSFCRSSEMSLSSGPTPGRYEFGQNDAGHPHADRGAGAESLQLIGDGIPDRCRRIRLGNGYGRIVTMTAASIFQTASGLPRWYQIRNYACILTVTGHPGNERPSVLD